MQHRKSKATRDEEAASLLLQRLKDLVERVGVTVREERLVREVGYHVRSGACRLHGQDVLLLDSAASAAERIEALLDFLSRRDLGDVYVEPELRRMVRGGDGDDEAKSA
jgi:hypothetical protein